MAATTTTAVFGFTITVIGNEVVGKRLLDVSSRIERARTIGVDRVGKYLFAKKKELCKGGLYGGQEVGPNTYRYGWQYLGGPAITKFTGATLNAHRLGKRINAATDRIEVVLDTSQVPYAAFIHGNIRGDTEFFYNEILKTLVKTRPWMKITEEERGEAVWIIKFTYQKRF